MAKQNKAMQYRQDGFLFVLQFLGADHTLEELAYEIEMREKLGIQVNIPVIEMEGNEGMNLLRDFVYQGQDLMWCMALRRFGFGKTRLARNLKYVLDHSKENLIDAYNLVTDNNAQMKAFLTNTRWQADERAMKEYQPSRYVQEYTKAREDGIKRGYEIVKNDGVRALAKQVTKKKYDSKMSYEEVTLSDAMLRSHFNEARITSWIMSLHINERFGNDRLNRAMDYFESAYIAVNDGILGYENYITSLRGIIDLEHDKLKQDDLWPAKDHVEIFKAVAEKTKKLKDEGHDVPDELMKAFVHELKKEVEEEPEPVEEHEQIEEPDVYHCFPCHDCQSKARCQAEGYKKECTCYALYKETRRTNVMKKRGVA